MSFVAINAQKIAETQQPQAIINKFGVTKKGQPWISYQVGDRKCSHFLSRKHFNQSLECLIYKINNVNAEVWNYQKKSHYFCSESRCSCLDYKFRSKQQDNYQCKHMQGLQSLSNSLPKPQSQSKPYIFAQPDEFILTGNREHGWTLWNQQQMICQLPTINHLNNVITQYLNLGTKIIYIDEKYQRFDVVLNQNDELVRRRQAQAS